MKKIKKIAERKKGLRKLIIAESEDESSRDDNPVLSPCCRCGDMWGNSATQTDT